MSSGQKEAWENSSDTEYLPKMSVVYVSDMERLLGKKYETRTELEDNMAGDFRSYVRLVTLGTMLSDNLGGTCDE